MAPSRLLRPPPPVPLTPLVGRVREVEALLALLGEARLVTLTGAGGSGKTRLALELLARRGTDDVAWVELAPVASPGELPQVVVHALGTREEIRSGEPAAVLPFVGDDPLFLVLDNCEHLVDGCAALVELLLQARPGLRVLATSREALGVAGERAWLVPPLELPAQGAPAETMARAEALRLFEDRARDVFRSFRLTPENTPVVAEICRRVDGIPLAIELAAARVRHLGPEQIRDRLSDLFDLLTSGGRRAVPRHRTLRAAIDWSHDLLPEEARELLHRLGVFRGGFTLDAAQAVGASEGAHPLEVLDTVALLVDRSLVQVHESDGSARYSLLETIRQYALAKLAEGGGEEEARARHAHHYATFVAGRAADLNGAERQAHVRALSADLENLREALAWTRAHDPARHVGFVGNLWWFWMFTRHWKESAEWTFGALALPEAGKPTRERARLLFGAGALFALQARADEARAFLTEAAEIARSVGDAHLRAYTENYLALSYAQVGDLALRPHAERALAWFRGSADETGLRMAILMSALEAHFSGDAERADHLSREAVEIARRRAPADLAIALQNWALILSLRAGTGAQPPDSPGRTALDRAADLTLASLDALRREHAFSFLARGLGFLGEVAGLRGDPLGAARLLGLSHQLRESIGTRPFGADAARLARVEPRLRAAVGDAAFEAAFREGVGLDWTDEVDRLLEGWTPAELDRALAGASGTPSPAEFPAAAPEPARVEPLQPPRPEPEADGAVPGLRILTLGPFELEGTGVEEGSWSYARPRELLVFLLLHPRGVTRQEIGEAIWPDATPPQVKNSFHVTLHHLRKRLGDPGWIVLEQERYRLDRARGLEWDAELFEAGMRGALRAGGAVDPGLLEGVLARYRGPLLDGVGSARWLEDARDDYRRLYLDGLAALARIHEERGDTEAALGAWSRVVATDELNEEAHRGLMRGWAGSGARERALRHFERLRVLLSETLEAEPEAETVRLHRELREGG